MQLLSSQHVHSVKSSIEFFLKKSTFTISHWIIICHWNSTPVWVELLSCKCATWQTLTTRKKMQNTWHEILKSWWFIYPITLPHLPTSNTNDIKNVERFDMLMLCTGDKTFCLPPFHHIRLWQRCCLISFLAQKAPLKSSQRWLWLTSFTDPPTHTQSF